MSTLLLTLIRRHVAPLGPRVVTSFNAPYTPPEHVSPERQRERDEAVRACLPRVIEAAP